LYVADNELNQIFWGDLMFAKTRTINRQYFGKDIRNFMEVPNLIEIQTSSYESFLQSDKLRKHEPILDQGLQNVFTSTFPIESPNGDMSLEYEFYELDWSNIKFSEVECKQKGQTYSVPLKARINLNFLQTGLNAFARHPSSGIFGIFLTDLTG
jgi:DNA-directed RNA polymerase subunit beta